MSDKGRRPFTFVLILILAIAAFVSLRPDSTEHKNATSSAPANASRQQSTSASTIDAKSETPSAGAAASGSKSAYPGGMSQSAPVRLEIRAPAAVRAGETFQATVDVGADSGIRKLAFTINFDKRVLQLVGSSAGTFVQHAGLPAQFGAQEPSDGAVVVNFDVDNGLAVAGAGSVVIMDFQALKAGSSPVTVDSIELVENGRTAASPAPVVSEGRIIVE
jgi:hypothetical protein